MSGCCLTPSGQFPVISWREQVTFAEMVYTLPTYTFKPCNFVGRIIGFCLFVWWCLLQPIVNRPTSWRLRGDHDNISHDLYRCTVVIIWFMRIHVIYLLLVRWGILDTTLCDKVCQWLATGRWFSPGTLVSSPNKIDRHDITEILLKVALNTITPLYYWILNVLFLRKFSLWCNICIRLNLKEKI